MGKRIRRTSAVLYTDKLRELSDNGQNFVSNSSLRNALGWDEEKYNRIRNELRSQGEIIVGRGYGGSVGFAVPPGSQALKVFVSYSHVDEAVKVELLKHLEPLRKRRVIETWHDRKIKAGDEWDKQISTNLQSADLILLIVSIDFINSDYCYDIELARALERHSKGEAIVIPIIARSCMWKTAPFASIQAVPKDGRPIALWPNQDEALSAIAESIKETAENQLSKM
jgi:hypothetical protein